TMAKLPGAASPERAAVLLESARLLGDRSLFAQAAQMIVACSDECLPYDDLLLLAQSTACDFQRLDLAERFQDLRETAHRRSVEGRTLGLLSRAPERPINN